MGGLSIDAPKPSEWCTKEYGCKIPDLKAPSVYFGYLFTLYKIQRGGFTIDNNDLSLDDWSALGDITECIEQMQDKSMMSFMGTEMYMSIVGGLLKKMGK